jgi:hypothetical protein
MTNNKTCTTCKETKPLESFYKRSKSKNLYTSQCKSCRSILDIGVRKSKRNGKRKGSRYNIDQKAFDNDDLTTWYLVGLLAADGCIDEANNRVRLTLHSRDLKTVNLLKEHFKYDGPLYFRGGGKYVGCEFTGVPDIVNTLVNRFNITQNKTATIKPPENIPTVNHALAYIIGYIDGDGCIASSHGNQIITIIGTCDILQFIKNVFSSYCNIDTTIKKIKNTNMVYKLSFGGNLKTGKYIYLRNKLLSIDVPKMDRKWCKI